jgi:hypothetical protein
MLILCHLVCGCTTLYIKTHEAPSVLLPIIVHAVQSKQYQTDVKEVEPAHDITSSTSLFLPHQNSQPAGHKQNHCPATYLAMLGHSTKGALL